MAFKDIEYLALANIKSIIPIKLKLFSISGIISKNKEDNFWSIFSISTFSSIFKELIELLSSKTDKGSINTVKPLEDVSWIKPFTSFWCSLLTGITNLLLRFVIIDSWTYFVWRKV